MNHQKIIKIPNIRSYISRRPLVYSPLYFWLCLLLLFSCQQLRLKEVRDYSGLLPGNQLLYASISVLPHKQNAFPYADITAAILEQPQLRRLLDQRLVRVQLGLGADYSLSAVAQLQLPEGFFQRQLGRQADWQPVLQPGAFAHRSAPIALEMPSSNVLFYWQGASAQGISALGVSAQGVSAQGALAQGNPVQGNPAALEALQQFHQAWGRGHLRAENWPAEIADLQDSYPIVLYSPMPLQLLLSPLVQRAFPAIAGTFHNIDSSFVLDYILLWIGPLEAEARPQGQGEGRYLLHMKVQTGNPLVARSLETAVRLVLPSLLFRSQQPFMRQQLPHAQIRSEGPTLHFSLPLDRAAVSGLVSSLPVSSASSSRSGP